MTLMQDKPIIGDLDDTELSQFTVGLLAHMYHSTVPVRYQLVNRTAKVRLAEEIDLGQLREQIAHVRKLSFNRSQLYYLHGALADMIPYHERLRHIDPYLCFLSELRLPEVEIGKTPEGQLRLETEGPWPAAMFWQTYLPCIVNGLRHRQIIKRMGTHAYQKMREDACAQLKGKVAELKRHPDIRFAESGTIQRFDRRWQLSVDQILTEAFAGTTQFRGTANVHNAHALGLLPIGTMTHQLPMVYGAIVPRPVDSRMRFAESQTHLLHEWAGMYGTEDSILLPDTFGSDFGLKTLGLGGHLSWKGVRHASGNPLLFAEKVITFYTQLGIDPSTKRIVFGDGLTVPLMQKLHEAFDGRIQIAFDWDGDLTNDHGIAPISIELEPIRAAEHDLVKITDDPTRAMGDPLKIQRLVEWGSQTRVRP